MLSRAPTIETPCDSSALGVEVAGQGQQLPACPRSPLWHPSSSLRDSYVHCNSELACVVQSRALQAADILALLAQLIMPPCLCSRKPECQTASFLTDRKAGCGVEFQHSGGRLVQEQVQEVILGYIVSLLPAWPTQTPSLGHGVGWGGQKSQVGWDRP